MPLSTSPYKGARDFYPEDKRIQKFMFNKLRQAVERFGYEEYDAPILEPLEIYAAKSGQEIVNDQTYNFTDRGGREVVIRPEMTPTVSRMVAGRRQELGYPLRWYSIPNLWRYERPQKGRLREHWQLNVDLFGVAGMNAELEIISIADSIFQNFGADRGSYVIKLNSRSIIDFILGKHLNLSPEQQYTTNKLIDRMHKISPEQFDVQLTDILSSEQIADGIGRRLIEILSTDDISNLSEEIKYNSSFTELSELIEKLVKAGITNVTYDPTLMRGFDYYTGVVFEISDTHPENKRSMMGGGRYDGLVGLFGVDPVPTVGFGLGDATLENFLTGHDIMPEMKVETDIYIVLAGEVNTDEVNALADRLRSSGCNVAIDLSGRKIGDQFKTAEKKSINNCLVVGHKELESKSYTLKNLLTGETSLLSEPEIISLITDNK